MEGYNQSGGGFTRASQAMTSRHLQANYSFMVTLRGGPVVFFVRVTPCFLVTYFVFVPRKYLFV